MAQEKMPGLAKKKISPHTIRHTTAVALLRATGDIDGVSKILGHASLNTTRIYTASDRTRLAETLNKVASALIPASEESWNPDPDLLTWLENL
jgi:site-specific recombinase XerD